MTQFSLGVGFKRMKRGEAFLGGWVWEKQHWLKTWGGGLQADGVKRLLQVNIFGIESLADDGAFGA